MFGRDGRRGEFEERDEAMSKDLKTKKIKELLLKAAKGYEVAEVTTEYAEVNGKMQVTKRKEIKKEVPGDLKALQMLLDVNGSQEGGAIVLTDEELEKEKQRLLKELKKGEKYAKNGT